MYHRQIRAVNIIAKHFLPAVNYLQSSCLVLNVRMFSFKCAHVLGKAKHWLMHCGNNFSLKQLYNCC